jgi:DNA-3-methyladenine glycosylase II
MSKPPKYWNRAKIYLSKKDKIMKILIRKFKDKTLTTRKDIFFSLCKSIIGQQISVAAANSVFKKFNKACKGKIKLNIAVLIPNIIITADI